MSTCHFSQSVVNQQSQHQVPPCLQCHDGSYLSLSLSALQCLYCQAKPQCFRLQFQGHQCKRPSSPTVPAHYRTSGVQLLTSYLTHVAIQFSHEPRSLTKHNLTLQALMPQFLFPTATSRHDARLSSTTHFSLCASRINYNLTNLSRWNSFSQYFSNFLTTLSSDSPGSLSLSAKITKLSSDSPGSHCQSHHNTLSLS